MRIAATRFHHDVLADLAREAQTYLEVGVREGDSVAAVVGANPHIAVTLIDTYGEEHGGTNRGAHAHVNDRLDAAGHRGPRTFYDEDSRVVLPRLAGQRFDLVHIDGDHSVEVASSDLRHAFPLAARWLVVHDFCAPAVYEAWRSILLNVRNMLATISISVSDQGTCVMEVRTQ